MAGHDIITIGASAGGLDVLVQLVRGLPPGFPASLFVVCHFPAAGTSMLPEILSRNGPLLASHPRDGDPIYPGQIYVAPPDYHLVLEKEVVRLSRGPRENHTRPAVDPLFRSAARWFGARVVGVIVSGALHDGVAGLAAVRRAGGLGVVQDPRDAVFPALPQAALDVAGADYVVPAGKLAGLLTELVQSPSAKQVESAMSDPLERMPSVVEQDRDRQIGDERGGQLTVYTCPECGGSLWQVPEKKPARFRCHVGHSYYAQALHSEQCEALEAALWTAVRLYRDHMVLGRQLAQQARSAGNPELVAGFEERAHRAERNSNVLQQMIVEGTELPEHNAGTS